MGVSASRLHAQDVGGQDKIRPLWRHYFTGTQGLIFVVDCADRDRLDEARRELNKIITDREMKDAIILIFANKQDIKGGLLLLLLLLTDTSAISPEEIPEKLGLHRLRDRNWYVGLHVCCLLTCSGMSSPVSQRRAMA